MEKNSIKKPVEEDTVDKNAEVDNKDSIFNKQLDESSEENDCVDEEKKEKTFNDFKKIIYDFSQDILKTYPELEGKLNEDICAILNNKCDDEALHRMYHYCEHVYPERFFDILYQNDEIFDDDDINTQFLPDLDFKPLWKENISDNTRQSIWKYLQLVLFTIVTSLSNEESFGDTAKMFEAINHDEFKNKLEETISGMQEMFEEKINESSKEEDNGDSVPQQQHQPPNLPNPNDIHEHVTGMMDGKLGKLAKEIAEETAKDLNIDMSDGQSVDGVFKNLFKQPTKLMSLVKNVGGKLDEKLKSGDIKESELLEEASDIMKKMKDMPGLGNLKDMFSKMGMNIPKGKMDLNAMKNNIDRNMKNAKQKERMQEKLYRRQMERQGKELKEQLNEKAKEKAASDLCGSIHSVGNDNGIEKMVFTTGESYEKSTKQQRPTGNKKKRKKKKK